MKAIALRFMEIKFGHYWLRVCRGDKFKLDLILLHLVPKGALAHNFEIEDVENMTSLQMMIKDKLVGSVNLM